MELLVFLQSAWTVIVMILFLGIVAWAYSGKRKTEFEQAAQLPLEDDDAVQPTRKEKPYV